MRWMCQMNVFEMNSGDEAFRWMFLWDEWLEFMRWTTRIHEMNNKSGEMNHSHSWDKTRIHEMNHSNSWDEQQKWWDERVFMRWTVTRIQEMNNKKWCHAVSGDEPCHNFVRWTCVRDEHGEMNTRKEVRTRWTWWDEHTKRGAYKMNVRDEHNNKRWTHELNFELFKSELLGYAAKVNCEVNWIQISNLNMLTKNNVTGD